MRINKYLAQSGVASRRKSEELILSGKVRVNNKLVVNLATDINPDNDTVTVEGNKVKPIQNHIYLMLNKPKGYVCTTSDDLGRKTIMDFFANRYAEKRIFPIGRLDYDSEGLLLMTTDGDLANRLMHPRNEVPKTYVAKVEGEIPESDLAKLRGGVELDGIKTNKCKIKLVSFEDKISRYEIVVTEGKNRQVRRMFETVNKEVIFLKRVAIGDLKLGGLYRGNYRELKDDEIDYLKKL